MKKQEIVEGIQKIITEESNDVYRFWHDIANYKIYNEYIKPIKEENKKLKKEVKKLKKKEKEFHEWLAPLEETWRDFDNDQKEIKTSFSYNRENLDCLYYSECIKEIENKNHCTNCNYYVKKITYE